MKNRMFFVIIITFTLAIPTVLFGFKNEPDGFRGIKWGNEVSLSSDLRFINSEINVLSKMVFLTPDVFKGESISFYEKANDELMFGDGKVNYIKYGFWKGKFILVLIEYEHGNNMENSNKIYRAFNERFDEPNSRQDLSLALEWQQMSGRPIKKTWVMWDGNKTKIEDVSLMDEDKGMITIYSKYYIESIKKSRTDKNF